MPVVRSGRATGDGSVWRFDRSGVATHVTSTGGRPLGVESLPDGRVLADSVAGLPLKVCNNAAVDNDGVVWFTDSSQRFPLSSRGTVRGRCWQSAAPTGSTAWSCGAGGHADAGRGPAGVPRQRRVGSTPEP